MADIMGSMSNFKDKLIPKSKDDEDVQHDGEELGTAENDVLEQFRISTYTELDEKVLTPSKINKVQFNLANKGFSMRQVDAFHAAVLDSIRWYVEALEKRDRDVHRLATEIDKYKTDYQNIRFQLELFQGVGGQAVTDESGNYVKSSELSEESQKIIDQENTIARLQEQVLAQKKIISDLEAENEEIREQAHAASQQVALPTIGLPTVSSNLSADDAAELERLREELAALDQWEQDVTIEYNRMEGVYNEAVAALEERDNALAQAHENLNASNAELEEARAGLQQSLEELNSVREEVAGAKAEVAEAQEALTHAQEQVNATEQNLAAANAEVKELSESLEQYKVALAEYVEANEEYQKELESYQNAEPVTVDNAETLARLEKALNTVSELTAELEEQKAHAASLDRHIFQLNEYINSIENNDDEEDTSAGVDDLHRVRESKYEGGINPNKLPADVSLEDLGLL